jgi:hypothetical protein
MFRLSKDNGGPTTVNTARIARGRLEARENARGYTR